MNASAPKPPGHLIGPFFEAPPTAPFATLAKTSRGRYFPEQESPTRSCYQRDRDRIIHSTAFRRLKHKTQVFVQHEGDYYRTRLTHSLEVAQVARSLCRQFGLDEDLAEAVALSHDLGHPPFGHAGEAALDQCMRAFGGFDHNAQALKLVTALEHRYADFDGLNLTWETLEGLVKHNGPLLAEGRTRDGLPEAIARFEWDLELDTYGGPEAQMAALSDDIAYVNHDIDDGLRAGLFEAEELFDVALAGPVFQNVVSAHPGLDKGRLIGESVRRMITHMVQDVAEETRRRLARHRPSSVSDIRSCSEPVVAFSPAVRAELTSLKDFLHRRMYRHPRVMEMMGEAQKRLTALFDAYLAEPSLLPKDWAEGCAPLAPRTARAACDYIAGMTDRYVMAEHRRIFHMEFPL